MRTKPVLFLAGVLLGIAIMGALQVLTKPGTPASTADPAAKLHDDLDAAEQRNKKLESEKAALVAEVLNLKSAPPKAASAEPAQPKTAAASPFAALFGGGGSDTNRTAAMSQMMKAAMQQQVDMRVSALKLRLGLTPEQEQSVRALFDKQFGMGAEVASKMFQGKLPKEEMKKMSVNPVDVEGEMKNLLTPEQYAEYEQYQNEERHNQAEMMANVQLGQLQGMLQLSEDQKDKVFDIIYQQGGQQFDPALHKQTNAANWQEVWGQQKEKKKESLRSVLTPEQMQIYEQHLESQRQMIKAFLPGADADSTGEADATVIVTPAPVRILTPPP